MAKLIIFNKPFQVLSQFSAHENKRTLSEFIKIPKVYPAGRLDFDSEGLLLLTDDGQLQHRIAHPSQNKSKSYWVLVEGIPDDTALQHLRTGVELNDGVTKPAKVKRIQPPDLWERSPPPVIKHDASWIEIELAEGKNRQVRRMTAAVGHPTLRLVRSRVAEWSLDDLAPGEYRVIEVNMPVSVNRKRVKGRRSRY